MNLRILALNLLCAGSLLAQENKLPAESLSPHFEAVSKHLELGGVFYAFADIDSDIKDVTKMIDNLLNTMRENGDSPIPPKLTAAGIVNELGLDSIKALGASSRKKGDAYHNRAFLATGNGPTGLLKIFGGKAAPFLSSTLAPAGSDIVMEEDLNLSVLMEVITNIAKQVGDDDMTDQLNEALEQPMGPLSVSVGEFLKKMNTKFTFIAKMDGQKKMNLKDSPVEIPMVDFLLALDNTGWLFPELAKVAKDSDEFEIQSGEGFEVIRPAKPLPPEMDGYKPLLYHDTKTNRLLVASSSEFLTTCLEGKTPLSGDEKFKAAVSGLPAEGNGLQYVSSNAIKEVWTGLKSMAKEAPEGQAGMMEKLWDLYLPKEGVPIASVRANLPDGILFTSNSSESHKSTIATMAMYPVAMVGLFGTSFMRQIGAAPGEMELEPEMHFEDTPGETPKGKAKEDPSEKIQSNLQQISFAGEAYFLDHPKEKEVTYAGLIKGGFLFEITPVDGEDYQALKLKRNGGKLSVTPKSGEPITQDYSAVTD